MSLQSSSRSKAKTKPHILPRLNLTTLEDKRSSSLKPENTNLMNDSTKKSAKFQAKMLLSSINKRRNHSFAVASKKSIATENSQSLFVDNPINYSTHTINKVSSRSPRRSNRASGKQSQRKSPKKLQHFTDDIEIDSPKEFHILDSLQNSNRYSQKEFKKQFSNQDINREIDKFVTQKRNVRSLKYRTKNFDWESVDYLNGGELLNEFINRRLGNKDFQLILERNDLFPKETILKKMSTTILDVLLAFLNVQNIALCNNINQNLGLCVQYLSSMLNAEKISIYLFDKAKDELYLKAANFSLREQISVKSNEGLLGRPFETGNILIADDLNYDDFPDDLKRFKKISDTLKELPLNGGYFPIKFGDLVLGVMEILNFKDPIDSCLKLTHMVCENIASGLMLHEIRTNQNLRTDSYINQDSKDLESLLHIIEADQGAIYIKELDENYLRLKRLSNLKDSLMDYRVEMDLKVPNPILECYNNKKIIHTDDFEKENQNEVTLSAGSRESLYLPLFNPKTQITYGVLHILFREKLEEPEEAIREATAIVKLLRSSIESEIIIHRMKGSLDLLDFTMNQVSEFILGFNQDFKLVYTNKIADNVLRRTTSDLVGKEIIDILGEANILIVSYILSAFQSDKEMIFENLKFNISWSQYSMTNPSYSSPVGHVPVNIKVICIPNNIVKYMVLIQPILLYPEKIPTNSQKILA